MVGLLVGFAVGFAVGFMVGLAVALDVGFLVGLAVENKMTHQLTIKQQVFTSLWQGTVFQWAAVDGCLLEANYGRRRYLANRPGTDARPLTRW